MNIKELILASSSPRRAELLNQLGVLFSVAPAHIDESIISGESALDYVQRIAKLKASYIAQQNPTEIVLGADTTVTLHGQILTKPENDDHAMQMLKLLSGKTHQVYTAVSVIKLVNEQLVGNSFYSETSVTFRTLSETEIADYIATRECTDKAGAYAIQGFAAVFVEHLSGSYSNVVGLPIAETARVLKEMGITIWNTQV